MSDEKDLIQAAMFREKHGSVGVYIMPYNAYVLNEENTNRHPDIFPSWIRYWKGLSAYGKPSVPCSVTGNELYIDQEYETLNNYLHLALNESRKGYADGAHVRLEGVDGIPDGVYITPMEHKQNSQFGEKVLLREGSILVKEVAPISYNN